jgi:hypothetical protein
MKIILLLSNLIFLSMVFLGQSNYSVESNSNADKIKSELKQENKKQIQKELEPQFRIFPNPSLNGVFTIIYDKNFKIRELNIYNVLGGKELNFKPEYKQGETIHLDLSNFPRGIYIVKIDSDNGAFLKKIMK